MKRKIYIVLIILFILSIQAQASNIKPPGLLEVDFSSVRADETVQRIQSFSIPVNMTGPRGVSIETPGLTNYQNNQKIPFQRLTLLLNNTSVVMDTSPLTFDFTGGFNNKQFDLKLDLELTPNDQPGIYQGVIQFRFWKTDQNQVKWSEPIQVMLKVRIEPWFRLKTDSVYFKLQPDTVRNNKDLQNTEPLRIQIASNTNWQLGISLLFDKTPVNNKEIAFMVKVENGLTQYQSAGQISITAQDGEKVIATGPATARNKTYWCEIPVDLYLNNYSKYPAGLYNFTVTFTGEIL